MIERILPPAVASAEAFDDPPDAALYPGEDEIVARAVESRRRQFTTARACARRALAQLGLPPVAILQEDRGAPLWPSGVVGSITHCDGFRASAVARSENVVTVGIDAEPNGPLPDGVLGSIGFGDELRWVRELSAAEPEVHWDRLLFSAKESVYKAWYPLARRWLGFEDAAVELNRDAGTFAARLLVPGPEVGGRPLSGFAGRWMAGDGLVITAIALAAED
ncbi:MAG: hypothetical protein QOK25_35 [Thermoleophilaceae bacterium]|nr:hypothetical protein [Thermoleophilaceae bacterium]